MTEKKEEIPHETEENVPEPDPKPMPPCGLRQHGFGGATTRDSGMIQRSGGGHSSGLNWSRGGDNSGGIYF